MEGLKQTAKKNKIDPNLVTRVAKIISENERLLADIPAHLLHGDFGYEHIFVDSGEVTGIIDFEDAKGGDPIWDFFNKDKQKIEWLMEGYNNKILFDDNYDTKMSLYKLCLSLDLLYYYDLVKFAEGVLISKNNLEVGLNFFK